MSTKKSFTFLGLQFGLFATVIMSILMLIMYGAGASPLPEPEQFAFAKFVFGTSVSNETLSHIGALFHFIYGGLGGLFYGRIFNGKFSLATGIGWGLVLWFLMQVIWLPLLGWGFFGSGISMSVALVTLIPHFVYGAVLGWLMSTSAQKEQ